jgi:hypothetical protein
MADGRQDARGFDRIFLPLDDMSTQGWQPFPEVTSSLVAQRARLSGEFAEVEVRNMGWALAAAKGWEQDVFESLLSGVRDPAIVQNLRMGAAEGAKVAGKEWLQRTQSDEQSRIDKHSDVAPSPTNVSGEVME